MEIDRLHKIFLDYPSVSTDTRKIKEGDIFFALKGDNFNGNEYAKQALEKGASYVVLDEKKYVINERTLLTDDVLETLQKLANYHRKQCAAKVISLTGSNGKTTTKELINVVLSRKYKTVATKGNLNNHIGVPLTLLSVKEVTEIAIVEMGANHQKEIEFLCKIAEPDFGYITNFGKAHLEGFGGVEGVIKGKCELYNYLMPLNKSIFLNADDPIQREKLAGYVKKYGYSTHDSKFYKIKLLKTDPYLEIEFENLSVKTKLIGAYNFPNCCAAILIGKYFNVELEAIKGAIENYESDNNRSQVINKNGHKIILDAYNANPTSMQAALESFKDLDAQAPILFLGDMFELGESAAQEHQYIAELAANLGFSDVVLIGKNFYGTKSKFQKFESFDDAKKHIQEFKLPQESTLFIKGSRGMALERILELI
ncbi:UDP-N-acetylmuramoyl-tripeptide--D-alanyl-D-alanine ligase [Maribacter aestuarii]|uniref:UDP-N-acetylmuramoyl-tripeptide--D-alanyl-D- alanine ligase n=1 Tax=Maribacter aestuarii TaxID=1130723 RepID=UPI00248B8E9A|nr:UDP-N-acetylmuramoyl-tripeptide--D-alanyl-D-alanine ligase [Maribacter aestuarii]